MLGHAEVGIEWDEAACATARAAGHERVQKDVATLDPLDWQPVDDRGVDGLIASPPCQAWSMAGKGGGRRDVEHVIACSMEMAAGNDTRAEHAAKCEDPRSILVVEALRWAVMLRPRWIAFEQVPPVLQLWGLYGQLLEALGYHVWTGVLEAERYGVPQTRERAVLMAHRDRPVAPPAPTHQRYVPGVVPRQQEADLFGPGLLPWVSMAEALDGRELPGWSYVRPATTIAGDSRVWPPGHKKNADDERAGRGGYGDRAGTHAIRITVKEASILQSFRCDYPWQGSRTKRFEQAGNAVPPPLAQAILGEIVEPAEMRLAA
jgi:DNA (cytosine-5)-methyltransferase 1